MPTHKVGWQEWFRFG